MMCRRARSVAEAKPFLQIVVAGTLPLWSAALAVGGVAFLHARAVATEVPRRAEVGLIARAVAPQVDLVGPIVQRLPAFLFGRAGLGFAIGVAAKHSTHGEALLELKAALPVRAAASLTIGDTGRFKRTILETTGTHRTAFRVVHLAATAAECAVTQQCALTSLLFLQRKLGAPRALGLDALDDAEADGSSFGRDCAANRSRLAVGVGVALAPKAAAPTHSLVVNTVQRGLTLLLPGAPPLERGHGSKLIP